MNGEKQVSHTEGKLQFEHRKNSRGYSTELFDENGETVATAAWYPVKTENGFTTNREGNARRLVACWNYCKDVPTELLEIAVKEEPNSFRSLARQFDRIMQAAAGVIAAYDATDPEIEGSLFLSLEALRAALEAK